MLQCVVGFDAGVKFGMTVFENRAECPGHRSAVNMLTRDRLCAAIGIEPEAYIDTLGWAMTNPSTRAPSGMLPSRPSEYTDMILPRNRGAADSCTIVRDQRTARWRL